MYLSMCSIKLNENPVKQEFEAEEIPNENKKTFNWAEVVLL